MSFLDEITPLKEDGLQALEAADSLSKLDAVRVQYLGTNGQFTGLLKQMGGLPKEDRPEAGKAINQAKAELTQPLDERREQLDLSERQLRAVTDTLPALLAFIGPDERYVFNNLAYERTFGITVQALRGMTVRESGTLYVDGATGLITRGTLHQRITREENEAQQLVANGTDTEVLNVAQVRKRKGYVNIEGDSFMKGWTDTKVAVKRGSGGAGTLGRFASDLAGGYQRQSGGRRRLAPWEEYLDREGQVVVAAA